MWVSIISLIIGYFLGLSQEFIRRSWKKKDIKQYAKKIIKQLCEEIEEGIDSCNVIIDMAKKENLPLSKIYVGFWETTNKRVPEVIDNIEILKLLHKIYLRFDRINLNMEHGRFGAGTAFAQHYLPEIESNYNSLKEKIESKYKIKFNTHK